MPNSSAAHFTALPDASGLNLCSALPRGQQQARPVAEGGAEFQRRIPHRPHLVVGLAAVLHRHLLQHLGHVQLADAVGTPGASTRNDAHL